MNENLMPRAISSTICQSVGSEVLVCNTLSGEVHCLPEIVARVFAFCDGVTPRSTVAQSSRSAPGDLSESLVEQALEELLARELLEECVHSNTISRRGAIGLAASLTISSVLLPKPTSAMSVACPNCTSAVGCPNCPGTVDPDCSLTACQCLERRSFIDGGPSTACSTDDSEGFICADNRSGFSGSVQLDCGAARASATLGGFSYLDCDAGPIIVNANGARRYYLCCQGCT